MCKLFLHAECVKDKLAAFKCVNAFPVHYTISRINVLFQHYIFALFCLSIVKLLIT
ncbi:uncharacterized protein BX663DRAFT_494170 [Cokeromyces recurvatus]|uniref:uncharacterized protein n=1 Tax=Cokeromyces recurvatus TaxID=90255 RepID=UPI002220E1FE|nr:uncharacterized protein BX663DRAFT_494170 [Cokeromyces recurvatus]KAI7906909.1 hypothetical protein BX663DRAFT_494170 [Cokeromyces recurvatus]